MVSTEDRVRELLQHAPPESPGINFYQLQRALQRTQRIRSTMRILAVAGVVAVVVAVGLVATHTGSPDTASQQLTDGPRFPTPRIVFSGPATASGTLEQGTRFTPPHHPAAAIPASVALHDVWNDPKHADVPYDATKVRVILAHLSRVAVTHPQDDWLVIFYGGCVYEPVPPNPTKHSAPSHAGCQNVPLTDIVNARTGRWLGTFGGGSPADPAQLLTPLS
jgi:hypothetical protein